MPFSIFNNFQRKTVLTIVLATLVLTSCNTGGNDFNFDSRTWKSDLSGCNGSRIPLVKQIESFRLKLITLREPTIRGLFGKPDAEELLERSNKNYLYYISPGPKCAGSAPIAEPKLLKLRFDALGKVREAAIVSEL